MQLKLITLLNSLCQEFQFNFVRGRFLQLSKRAMSVWSIVFEKNLANLMFGITFALPLFVKILDNLLGQVGNIRIEIFSFLES